MPLLERDDVLARLRELLEAARQGSGRLAVVRGEAGIGKTSVVRWFIEEINDQAHVLWGGCDDLLIARPLGPLWDMVLEEPSLEAVLAGDDRVAAFQAVLELLGRSLRPSVMIIEDVHWADDATLDLIKFVGRRIDRTHGLIVLTFRDGEAKGDQPLHMALGDLPHGLVERMPLEALSPEAVAKLAGRPSNELWELTSGNPFFVSELVTLGEGSVPSSIIDAIGSKVLRLGESGRAAVELCSVVPSRTELSMVEALLEDPWLGIDEALEVGLLHVVDDSVTFKHELARRAVEVDLSESRRRELNTMVLEWLDRTHGELSRKAHHARAAGDVEAMLRLLPAAASAASAVESHREAYGHLQALLPYKDLLDEPARAAFLDQIAYEQYLVIEGGGVEAIEESLRIRRGRSDPDALGASLLTASRIYWVSNQRQLALDRAHEAAVLTEAGSEHMAMAYSTLSQLAMLGGSKPETLRYAEKALELVDDTPSRPLAHALNNIGTIKSTSNYPEGVDELTASFEMSAELRLPHDQTRAAVNIAWAAIHAHDLEAANIWIDRGLKIIQESEMASFETYLLAERVMVDELRGKWGEAMSEIESLFAAPALLATSRVAVSIERAVLLVRTGAATAEGAIGHAWTLASGTAESQRIGPAAAAAAEYLFLGGELTTPGLEELLDALNTAIRLDVVPLVGEIGQWLLAAGVIDELPALASEPYSTLASGDWKTAAQYWERAGIPYERAFALSHGDVAAKIEALRILDGLGAIPLASRLRTELTEAGVKGVPRGPRRSTSDSPLGLTSRQSEVLELLAQDLTNAEIADRLFLSTRTVDHHVAAILSKLSAENRYEAVETAREGGLLGEITSQVR